jgi:uncharacterized protein YukE
MSPTPPGSAAPGAFATTGAGPGSFAGLNSAGEQKNWFEQAAGRGSSWVAAGQGLADATSPPEVAVATVQARAEILQTLMSPGQALMSNGLGFLVSIVLSPLVELAEWAIGDPEQMRATGEGWAQVASWLDQVAKAEGRRAEATRAVWVGESGDAFRKQIIEFADGVSALAEDVRGLKDTLDLIADLFDTFVEFVIQILTELVIGLIVEWLAALAASWITAGGSTAAAAAATTAEVGVTGGRISARIAQLQGELARLVTQMERLLQRLRGPLRQVVERMSQLRGGNAAQRFLGRQIDGRSPLGAILTRADPATLASRTGNRFLGEAERLGETGLAANVSQLVLGRMLGGSTRLGGAAWHAATDTVTDAAIQFGAEAAYGETEDQVTGTPSKQQRQAAEERGFRW